MTELKANQIGKCPICDNHVELIESVSPLIGGGTHYTTKCKNEYYHHIRGDDNSELLEKYEPPRTKRAFLGEV